MVYLLKKIEALTKTKYYFYFICALFGISFLIIPLFQINSPLIVWLTIALLSVSIFLYCLSYRLFKLDFIIICFALYPIIAIITTIANRLPITWTMPLLQLLSILIYILLKHDKIICRKIIFSIFLGLLVFNLILIFKEGSQLINYLLNKNYFRLGSSVGDENEIGMFLSLGACLSIYYLFFSKKKKYKIIALFPFFLFLFSGILTGSKEVVISIFLVFVLSIIMLFGKSRWYFSLLIIISIIVISIAILMLPIFSSFAERFFSMLSFFSGKSFDSSTNHRLEMFVNGLELFTRRPIFGFGIRAYYYYSCIGGGGWSHNTISEVLCSYGFIGFSLFIMPYVFAVVMIFLKRIAKDLRMTLVILVFLVSWFTTMSLDTLKIYPFLISFVCATVIKTKPTSFNHAYSYEILI